MSFTNSVALIVDAVAILLSLAVVVVLLWKDARSGINLMFSAFLVMVVIWTGGALFNRFSALVGTQIVVSVAGARMLEIGFTGSCVGLYIFVMFLTGDQGWRFIRLLVVCFALVVTYQVGITLSSISSVAEIRADNAPLYAFSPVGVLIYLSFPLTTFLVVWRRQRRIKSQWLKVGIYGFCVGLAAELISPELRARAIGIDISAISALTMSYAMLREQVIDPLTGRAAQLQAVRDVGLAITSRLRLEEVLSTVATQAAGILGASSAVIFLNQNSSLELAAVHNMNPAFLGKKLAAGEGLAGHVALTRQANRIDHYRRDWTGEPDIPNAKETFGAVVAAPLIFGNDVMGVLMVIEGLNGKRFGREDVNLLELLSPQAAVAITNSRLFEQRVNLIDELEAAKNQLETFLTSTDNPVIALNRRLEIIFANPAVAALFGGNIPSGRSIHDLIPPDVLPPRRVIRTLLRQGACTYELTTADRTYLCHLSLIRRPRQRGFVAVLNDVTELKELDRLKNHMIQLTSHNLKNPLAAAMNTVELMREDVEEDLPQQLRLDLDTVWTELQRMEKIVVNILNLERVQSGKLVYEECAVDQLIWSALHDFQVQAIRRGLKLEMKVADNISPLVCNQQFMTQALSNLVENAVKFTPEGGTITVSAGQDAECVSISIADTGVGIPREDLSRVFERFFRAHQPGTNHLKGSGLGLSLVKAVVDVHGGRIWLESEVNKGTTFHLALPISQPVQK